MTTFVDFICAKLNTTYSALSDILSAGIKNYTPHVLKTKNKARTVYEPSEFLRNLQLIAVNKVFSKHPVSLYSTAYEQGCSVLKNAKKHQNAKFMLKYDIKDFFGSIRLRHFESLLIDSYNYQDINLLWKICSLNDCLPVGAYSSSFIANRVMYAFDIEIGKKIRGITYTRYADDMIFSSDKELPTDLTYDLEIELRHFRLELNSKKTHRYNALTPKKVTGVTVTPNNKLTVGKKYKLAIKKQLYDYIFKNRGNRQKIIGRLNYIKFIEPSYYQMLFKKYRLDNNLLKSKGKLDNGNTPLIRWQHYQERNDPSSRPSKSNCKKTQPKTLAVILICFALIACFAGFFFYNNYKDSDRPVEVELTKQNYVDYIDVFREYSIRLDSTEFRLTLINKSDFLINDIVIDFCILNKNSIIYLDTIRLDILGKFPKEFEFQLDKAHPGFSDYVFQYVGVRGTVTTQPY